jgi:uncharacterized protein YkwD
MRLVLAVLPVLAACSTAEPAPLGTDAATSMPDAGPCALPQYACDIIAEHNAVRASAMPVPTPPLSPLSWSDTVAAVATAWANNCVWMHNQSSGYGENIAATLDSSQTPKQVVDLWAAEAADYNLSSNSCAAGKECGHYTQIVWRNTSSVGCATVECTSGSPFGAGAWTFTVCDYSPPGNFVGQRPY